ncbi:AAA domain-containing protein, partial [Mesorhizobium sp. M2A.F.Ca.ET.039.01.1.1]|uniref:AAA domain-containing protein n=1 Tax=Mesorhizobium sp. M2A.F.Ca.ET.039.01.1.1 TaxID=2496746 RepID=UPI000FF7B4AF
FFAEDRTEPTIVKNLENVQGDERDVILFSITFYKDPSGRPPAMDFGALNREGGERRLNVAVTRARQELIVFSGFTADQIDPSRSKAIAVQHLKTFLDYAERGPIALPSENFGSVGDFDSPFEEAVADHLEQRGWTVVPQVGISDFRIDLGIRHPDLAGAYLAGVECDGATYHRCATARDRDKVREQVLTGLGWTILRVWSTDWWFDAGGCAERLHTSLMNLLEQNRARHSSEQTQEATVRWQMGQAVEPTTETAEPPPTATDELPPLPATLEVDLVSANATTNPEALGFSALATMADQGNLE